MMLLDDIFPEYQINEVHSVEVNASAKRVYRTILDSTFITDSLVFRVLFGLRELPSKLFGKGEETLPKGPMKLTDLLERSKFVLLGEEENEEMVFGLIGRFWNILNTDERDISDLAEFNAFDQPGYGKAVINFYLEPSGDRTKLRTETRVHFSDEKYLRRFRVYWFFIGFFSGLMRGMFLRKVRADAEKAEANGT